MKIKWLIVFSVVILLALVPLPKSAAGESLAQANSP